jgi:hypothetical protein
MQSFVFNIVRIIIMNLCFSCLVNASELQNVTAEKIIKENSSTETKMLVNFLIKQFEGKKVNQLQIEKLWNDSDLKFKYMMARFQIIDQKVYADSFNVSHYYFPVLLKYFQKLVQKYKIANIDFIIYLREEIPIQEESSKYTMNVPAFIMFQNRDCIYEMDKIIFPDGFFLKENNNYSWTKILDKVDKASQLNVWENKIEKLFWRGITTGDFLTYSIKNFDKLPRLTVVILSKLYPELIDAKFSFLEMKDYYRKDGKSLRKILELLFPEGFFHLEQGKQIGYKYLLSIDGNAATGTRVPWIMNSNSLLVKQRSHKIQWFYPALKEYVHYVPLEHRLTDAFEQLEWMKNNDNKIKKIAYNARNFVQNNLTAEHIENHVVLLLNEYHKIQQDEITTPTLPSAEESISISSVMIGLFYRAKNYLYYLCQ